MKTTQMLVDGWMNKENVEYTDNGILLNFKKEGNLVFCNYMDEPRGCYMKWNKPVTEEG